MQKIVVFLFFTLIIVLVVFSVLDKSEVSLMNIISQDGIISTKDTLEPNTSTISVDYLRKLNIDSEEPNVIEELSEGTNYKRYLASYMSDGNKIFGLLTVPTGEVPDGGYSAIVFNHGYIPPSQYVTTEKYVAYVDYLARNGFVVFKIDLRGNGESEGTPTGSYFSSGYTIDAISALKSLQKLDYVDANKIGMWGHSMAGNLVLRAMLVEEDVKAGVIWSGAVYSYEDFAKYRLNDGSYVRRQRDPHYDARDLDDILSEEVTKLRETPEEIDYNNDFWSSVSLTKNISYLNSPVQLHHAVNDPTVNIGYARDLARVLEENNKIYELYEYLGGGHNIDSPYYEQAMQRTVEFFRNNL